MAKVILISILLATIALPARAAREKNARKGLRRTLVQLSIFYAIYLFALMFIWARFL